MITKDALWIIAEFEGARIAPVTLQLLTKARAIANGRAVAAVVLETPAQHGEATLAQYGADEIIVVQDDGFAHASDRTQAKQLTALIQAHTPNTVLFGATPAGRSLAPRVQDQLETGLTADCLDLYYEQDLLVAVKPSYGDNVMCEIVCPERRPQMASVRPNTFSAKKATGGPARIERVPATVAPDAACTVQNTAVKIAATTSLSGARKIIALGRGANKDAVIAGTRQLAEKLGASIGVSRPLTDRPDFTAEQQIGQSGVTVSPDLIINLGISGAVQYQVGMSASKLVISANRDPKAPIMAQSDYVWTGDAAALVAALQELL
ncbi:electron transfer flavoprotein subunit alpha/FixB family protein [Lacticaseibacillus camelliae]|uniref:Electron transfer flavoprotein FAD-binding domain protein n=2 Tax=Lacticaseibacillus camelliae TaxID=381742 RepID=A0A0R2F132_9LACO|nr:electron transfer flavoprotein subunit alpha/FixB family protein [Lacticaseibacillus camelliae]KRN21542.1 electron transfer flavoprotein FAD-binding domain protein [Lacticaseibacillus camelliae DSM 22697 = JCM 13995]